MNIHEHQAKDLIKKFGAPVSKGVVIFNLNEIDEKIKQLTVCHINSLVGRDRELL